MPTGERLNFYRGAMQSDGCIAWTGSVDTSGYARMFVAPKWRRAHRVAWEIEVGAIPDGLTIDHLCRTRTCTNTDHMEVVTARENIRRAAGTPRRYAPRRRNPARAYVEVVEFKPRGYQPKVSDTHCPHGHEFTPENTRYSQGRRKCRTCGRIADRERKRRKRAAARAERAQQ